MVVDQVCLLLCMGGMPPGGYREGMGPPPGMPVMGGMLPGNYRSGAPPGMRPSPMGMPDGPPPYPKS
jgi:hypothetical protein